MVSASSIETSLDELCKLTDAQAHQTLPLVILYDKNLKLDLPPSNYSMLVDNQLIAHLSGVFVASKNQEVWQIGEVINTMFLGGKVQFFDEFEEAFAAAKQSLGAKESILEKQGS